MHEFCSLICFCLFSIPFCLSVILDKQRQPDRKERVALAHHPSLGLNPRHAAAQKGQGCRGHGTNHPSGWGRGLWVGGCGYQDRSSYGPPSAYSQNRSLGSSTIAVMLSPLYSKPCSCKMRNQTPEIGRYRARASHRNVHAAACLSK